MRGNCRRKTRPPSEAARPAEGLKLRPEQLSVRDGNDEIFQLGGLLSPKVAEAGPALSDPEVIEKLTGNLFRIDDVQGQIPHPHFVFDAEDIDIFTAPV